MQRRGARGCRGNNYSGYSSNDTGGGQRIGPPKENGNTVHIPTSAGIPGPGHHSTKNDAAPYETSSSNGSSRPTSLGSGSTVYEAGQEASSNGINKSEKMPPLHVAVKLLQNSNLGPTPTSTPGTTTNATSEAGYEGRDSEPTSGDILAPKPVSGVDSSASDPVLLPSLNSQNPGAAGTIKCETGIQKIAPELSEIALRESRLKKNQDGLNTDQVGPITMASNRKLVTGVVKDQYSEPSKSLLKDGWSSKQANGSSNAQSIMDDNGARPQSLILVVSRAGDATNYNSIIRLKTPVPNHERALQLIPTKFSANIPDLEVVKDDDDDVHDDGIWWGMSPSSTGDLYLFPSWLSTSILNIGSFPGLILNLSTKKCKIIKSPLSLKSLVYVVTMADHIYLMSQPRLHPTSFERYNTLSQSWEELEPPPPKRYSKDGSGYKCTYIKGSAVLDDTILFNYDEVLLAYNVGRNKWYTVKVLNSYCYSILGEAVVLNKSIYTLESQSVLTLTLKCQETNGDPVYTCDLNKEYVGPHMLELEGWEVIYLDTRLVHLGEDNFCIVQSCSRIGSVESLNQYIRTTYITLSEEKFIMTNICLHKFKRLDGIPLEIKHCFSMPVHEDEDEADKSEIVTLPPELVTQYQNNCKARREKAELEEEQRISRRYPSISRRYPSRDHADVPKKSSASMVAAKSNVPSSATKASTCGYVQGRI